MASIASAAAARIEAAIGALAAAGVECYRAGAHGLIVSLDDAEKLASQRKAELMAETTPDEIHETIVAALGDRARRYRNMARSRSYSGPRFVDSRALARTEAELCEGLQRVLRDVSPEALASLLAAKEG